jgi:hypothetical protein
MYNNMQKDLIQKIQNQVNNLGYISIQLDIWTSNTSKSYLGVIASWLNPSFKLEYYLIGKY